MNEPSLQTTPQMDQAAADQGKYAGRSASVLALLTLTFGSCVSSGNAYGHSLPLASVSTDSSTQSSHYPATTQNSQAEPLQPTSTASTDPFSLLKIPHSPPVSESSTSFDIIENALTRPIRSALAIVEDPLPAIIRGLNNAATRRYHQQLENGEIEELPTLTAQDRFDARPFSLGSTFDGQGSSVVGIIDNFAPLRFSTHGLRFALDPLADSSGEVHLSLRAPSGNRFLDAVQGRCSAGSLLQDLGFRVSYHFSPWDDVSVEFDGEWAILSFAHTTTALRQFYR